MTGQAKNVELTNTVVVYCCSLSLISVCCEAINKQYNTIQAAYLTVACSTARSLGSQNSDSMSLFFSTVAGSASAAGASGASSVPSSTSDATDVASPTTPVHSKMKSIVTRTHRLDKNIKRKLLRGDLLTKLAPHLI